MAHMKVLIVIGSARKDGNTEKLCRSFAAGLQKEGHETVFFHLGEKNVKGCLGCNACHTSGRCIQKDDFPAFLELFEKADCVAYSTPLYFWSISSQLKALIDRFYSIGTKDSKGYYKYPIKKCVMLATAADSSNHFWSFELIEQYYRRLVKYLHWEDLGVLTVGSCGGSVSERCIERTGNLEKAVAFGERVGRHLTQGPTENRPNVI